MLLEPRPNPIRITHRHINNREIFFLINDSAQSWQGYVTFAAKGDGEQWDPATGEHTLLSSSETLSLKLGPYGGMLYRFKSATPLPLQKIDPTRLPRLTSQPLTPCQPTCSHGTWVTARFSSQADSSGKYQAEGILQKSDTDTYEFIVFDYPNPEDCSDIMGFRIPVFIPARQPGATPLRIIVRDRNGIEYMATTEFLLSEPLREQVFLPRWRFEWAGWNTLPPPIDWSAIVHIRVGWGGYFGKKGERLTFLTGAPEKVLPGK